MLTWSVARGCWGLLALLSAPATFRGWTGFPQWPRGALAPGRTRTMVCLPDVNYIHPSATTTSPHRVTFSQLRVRGGARVVVAAPPPPLHSLTDQRQLHLPIHCFPDGTVVPERPSGSCRQVYRASWPLFLLPLSPSFPLVSSPTTTTSPRPPPSPTAPCSRGAPAS